MGLFTRRMLDHRIGPVNGGGALLARRAQITCPDLTSQGLIRLGVAEFFEFVAQRARPQMRILGQACGHVGRERFERIAAKASHETGVAAQLISAWVEASTQSDDQVADVIRLRP